MPEPTLHELNQHLFAALLPVTHGAEPEPEQAPKRAKKAAPVILGDDQLDTTAQG